MEVIKRYNLSVVFNTRIDDYAISENQAEMGRYVKYDDIKHLLKQPKEIEGKIKCPNCHSVQIEICGSDCFPQDGFTMECYDCDFELSICNSERTDNLRNQIIEIIKSYNNPPKQ
jgi:hypothetical protein